MGGARTHVHFYVRVQSDGAAGWRLAHLSAQLVWGAARCSTTSPATSTAERRARLNWTRYQTTGQALLHRSCQVAGQGEGNSVFESQGDSGCRCESWGLNGYLSLSWWAIGYLIMDKWTEMLRMTRERLKTKHTVYFPKLLDVIGKKP